MKKAKPLQCESSGGGPVFLSPCHTDAEEAEMIVEQVERLLGGTSYFSLDSGRVASHEGDLSLSMSDMGVLYRLNAQGDVLENALDRARHPFCEVRGSPAHQKIPHQYYLAFPSDTPVSG